jgi:hypothetical protein
MKQQESIRRIIREVRVPRSERVELYRDDNIIVVVPLTHRALQKYANQCQWCINSDVDEWEDYHKGKHVVIIQRNPKKPKMGITGHPTASEIFLLSKWDNNESSFEDVGQMLDYEFRNDRTMADYYVNISNDINNFATNIVYYSPENGIYDQEDNFLWNFSYEITDIPNVTPEVIKIMDDYLQENEEMSIQENIRRILREETSIQSKLLKMIKNDGIIPVAKKVNGINNLGKILNERPTILLGLHLQNQIFSSNDFKSDYTEGYDFKFQIRHVELDMYGTMTFYYKILEGTVTVTLRNGEEKTYDLADLKDGEDGFNLKAMKWELKYLFEDFTYDLARQLKLDEDDYIISFEPSVTLP